MRHYVIVGQLLDALREFATPAGFGFVEAIDAETAAYPQAAKPKKASAKGIEMQLDRLQNLYVMGGLAEPELPNLRSSSARAFPRSWPSGTR